MRVATLLNRIEKLKSFVYKKVCLEEVDGKEAVIIEVRPRKNSPPVRRVCMKRRGIAWRGPWRLPTMAAPRLEKAKRAVVGSRRFVWANEGLISIIM